MIELTNSHNARMYRSLDFLVKLTLLKFNIEFLNSWMHGIINKYTLSLNFLMISRDSFKLWFEVIKEFQLSSMRVTLIISEHKIYRSHKQAICITCSKSCIWSALSLNSILAIFNDTKALSQWCFKLGSHLVRFCDLIEILA
jgi:hypothetical protein